MALLGGGCPRDVRGGPDAHSRRSRHYTRPVLQPRTPPLADFRALVLREPLRGVVEAHILGGPTFAYAQRPSTLTLLFGHLADRLSIASESLYLVGSAKLGFSLSPDYFGRPFSRTSDLDVAVIDPELFDSTWYTLLAWHYPRRSGLPALERAWMAERRREIYWGWFVPTALSFRGPLGTDPALRPLRDTAQLWFDAFQSLSIHRPFAVRKVSGRLYRTLDHALAYHEGGLAVIKAQIEEEGS